MVQCIVGCVLCQRHDGGECWHGAAAVCAHMGVLSVLGEGVCSVRTGLRRKAVAAQQAAIAADICLLVDHVQCL